MAILARLAEDPKARIRTVLVLLVARERRFRRATVERWDNATLASEASRMPPHDALPFAEFLRALHFAHRRALLQGFFDKLGIRLTGRMEVEGNAIDGLAAREDAGERIAAAADLLLASHPARDVLLWLLTARILYPQIRPYLDVWLESLELQAREGVEEATASGSQPSTLPSAGSEEVRGPEPDEPDSFTTLDRVVVHAVVDAAQQVEGSLSPEEVDDLVQELVALNGRRHRSYFHLGLKDVLFPFLSGGTIPADLGRQIPAENESRRRWYWSGVVQALARLNRQEEILRYYDSEPVVRSLGGDDGGPSRAAALHIVKALSEANRHAEVASFLQPEALLALPDLTYYLHSEATRLLRADRAGEARPLVDLLEKFVEKVSGVIDESAEPLLLEIRRRRAHCYRQLGEFPTARSILERLLANDPDREVKAMVTADLGLIDAGFRRLADLRIPDRKTDRAEFVHSLERGRPRFQEAAAFGAKYSAHGRYCLGVLEAARGQWGVAVEHLEMALSVFAEEPERYGEGKLLARARVYLGAAICHDLQSERLHYAGQQIKLGLADGAELPADWVNTVLEALELVSPGSAAELSERILTSRGPEVLDALVESSGATGSVAVARALLARVRDERRGEHERVKDAYAVLPRLLQHQLLDEAGEVLDFLEEKACAGIESEKFLGLVRDPSKYEPVWESEDAFWSALRCLESLGKYQEAAEALAQKFHRVLSSGKYQATVEAAGIVERIRGYGLEAQYTEPLEVRLQAVASAEEDVYEGELPVGQARPINVLFVGGDQRQKQYDEEIHRELAHRLPNVRVRFVHPGWSSNWRPKLDECMSLLEWADAVVIMPLIRTEFGRRLRKAIKVPWRGCAGHGKGAILNSILAAAAEVRSRHMELHGSA
jgi:tetratricopeptide (TPR) repeat protein